MTHLSVFLSATFVHCGLLLLLLFSSASFLEMTAAAFALLLADTFPDPPPSPGALLLSSAEFKLTSFLPIFTVMVTVSPAVTCWAAPVVPPAFLASVLVAFFSSLAETSDWKNWILDCSVFATVVEERGAGDGLVAAAAAEEVVVNVGPEGACEVTGLEAKDVQVSLAVEESAETGRAGGGDGAESVLEKLGGVLVLSFCHVGPSLEEMSVLVFLGSLGGVGLESEVFVGKSLREGQLVMGASDLSKHNAFSVTLNSA